MGDNQLPLKAAQPLNFHYWQSRRAVVPWVLFSLIVLLALASAQVVLADQTIVRKQAVGLNVGESLVIQSNRTAIQRIFIEGNVSDTNLTKPAQYPASEFELSASNPHTYGLRVLFDYPTDYAVNMFVKTFKNKSNNTSYYVSSGPFELDVNATFNSPSNATVLSTATDSVSPMDSLVNWTGKFSQAFPLWVKLLYLGLGIQFFVVGGLWIRRETTRKESGTQKLDAGDKAFLWLDVAYKFLLVSFVAIVAIMGGELLILFVLRFMFLASIDLLTLWDLFVVGFAAGAVIMVYLIRFTLEKAFDLKPIED